MIVLWVCDVCGHRLDANPRDYRLAEPTTGPDDRPASPVVLPGVLADQVERARDLGWTIQADGAWCPRHAPSHA